MSSPHVQNFICRGQFNTYLVGGCACNAFTLGAPGSNLDFFLVGAETGGESNTPLLTGNFLDAGGQILFRLVRNTIVSNPGLCTKVLGDHPGYEIRDSKGRMVFQVQTRLARLQGEETDFFLTTFGGDFYNKFGELLFSAALGSNEERPATELKGGFGFNGEFALTQGMSEDELSLARLIVTSRGAIHTLLSGTISNQELVLDGAIVSNARVSDCTVKVATGDFAIHGDANQFQNCGFEFSGSAANVRNLVLQLLPPPA